MALNDAVVDMQRGRIDYAIVGGSSALFRPATSLAFLRLKYAYCFCGNLPDRSFVCAKSIVQIPD
jgi:hypothetical protein